MIFKNNATYRFICRADTERALNVYGSTGSIPSPLKNVCLYDSSPSDTCQQWIYKEKNGNKYFVCKMNPELALDMYTGSVSGQNNVNAHVYGPSATSYLAFEDTDSGYIKIKLARYSDKYLTANQGDNGDNDGRTTHDPGNVYWYAGGLTDHSQEWKPILVDDGGSVDPEPGEMVTVTNMPNGIYDNNTEYFHPQSGMKNGTWAENSGSSKKEAVKAFYTKAFGHAPISDNHYLYNLYGAKYSVSGYIGKYHTGIDMYSNSTTSIKSAHSGIVVSVGSSGYGEVAIYDEKLDKTYIYLHMDLSKTQAVINRPISIGTFLGYQSSVGLSKKNDHLHIEVRNGRKTSPAKLPTITQNLDAVSPYNYL